MIVKIVVFGVIATICIVLLREHNPQIATLISIGSAVLIALFVLDELFEVVYTFYNIADTTGIDKGLFSTVIKIIGIGYLSEFGNNICIDAGAKNVGDKVMLAGKITIMVMALPILTTLIDVITEILP